MEPSRNAKMQKIKIGFMQRHYTKLVRLNCDFYFSVSRLAIFSNRSHLDWSLLFNFETTRCKNQFDTKLASIHLALIEILSFSCLVHF